MKKEPVFKIINKATGTETLVGGIVWEQGKIVEIDADDESLIWRDGDFDYSWQERYSLKLTSIK